MNKVVDEVLAGMTLEQKAAQLLFLHVYGSGQEVDAEQRAANERLYGAASPEQVVATMAPGGVIYIERNPQDPDAETLATANLESLEQIRRLSAALQSSSPIGLLIAADHEQGPVRRLPSPASELLGGRALGATGDRELARDIAETTGRELAAVGINLNLAPVADVNTVEHNPAIGDRAFGSSPELVADMVTAQIRGYHDAGIGAVAKHFPGHGAATVDSHTELPVVRIDEEEWRHVHLPPFRAAVDADVDGIMTAHLVVPSLGGGQPATVDEDVVSAWLRRRLGFDGVVLTDSLWMRAIREHGDDVETALRALEAGCDVLLMPPDARGTIRGIAAAVRDGRLSEERLDRSVRRVLTLKATLGVLGEPSPRGR